MSFVRQISGFEKRRVEQPDLGDFASNAIDLNPVSNADAVLAHERKPAEKRENVILQGNGDAGGGEAQDGRQLTWRAKHHQQNEYASKHLHTQLKNSAQGLHPSPVKRWIGHQPLDKRIAEDGAYEDEENECQ